MMTTPKETSGGLSNMLVRTATRFLTKRGFTVSETRYSKAYLQRYGFNIRTFIDVGVFKGTPVFYDLFKDAKLVLIDPLPSSRKVYDELRRSNVDVDFVEVAAGAGPGEATLHDNGPSSSLLERRDGVKQSGAMVVGVKPLDDILKPYDGPFGIKIDTEGFDLEVIRGAAETLKRTEFVFSEVSLRQRFTQTHKFSEFIAEMAAHGFEAAEIILHPHHNRFADVLFVRAGSSHLEPDAVRARKPGKPFPS